jgi:hypothetical protein
MLTTTSSLYGQLETIQGLLVALMDFRPWQLHEQNMTYRSTSRMLIILLIYMLQFQLGMMMSS